MKKTLLFLNIILACTVTFFASCSKDDDIVAPPTQPEEPATPPPTTYTVMLYGCGGGNLDIELDYNLEQIVDYGKTSRVNFTGLVKYSMPYQSKKDCEGTRLLNLTEDGLKNEKKYEASYRLDNPEHLANFIKKSKEKMPADKYILIFWNHGCEFGPSDKLVQSNYPEVSNQSRSVCFDDNTGNELSTYEIEKGIKDSGTKLDLIYFDVSMMGMVEPFYQLKDCTKYMMASSHNSYGGNYTQLLNNLQEKDSLVDAIKDYVPAVIKEWQNKEWYTGDLACYDMQYMDEFAQHAKTATDEVVRLKKEKTEIPEGFDEWDERQQMNDDWFSHTQFGEQYNGIIYPFDTNSYSVDLCSLLTKLAGFYHDGKLSSAATLVRSTLEKMTVVSASSGLPQWLDRVSLGVTWPTPEFIDLLSDEYKQILRNSAFNQATGWDKILLDTKNPTMSWIESAYYSRYYFFYEGELSAYKYAWDVMVSVDESKVYEENREAVRQIVSALDQIAAGAMAQNTYPLRHSRALAADLYFVIDYQYKQELMSLGVKKINVHVQLKDGESIDPDDKDAVKHPTTVDQEFEFEGANFL